MMRYSVACRPVTKGERLIHPGHGGRWVDVPANPKRRPVPCPMCNRPMVQTGEVQVRPIGRSDAP